MKRPVSSTKKGKLGKQKPRVNIFKKMGFYLLASLLVVGRVAGLEDQRSVLTPLGGDNKASWEEVREAIDR